MKNLLIILSLLLLSFPVIGQETGVLYYWERSSGQVWKTFRDKDTQPKYKGQVEKRRPNGQGTYTLTDGNRFGGEWKDEKPWNLHNIRQKRKHHRKVGEWSITEINPLKLSLSFPMINSH